ncbi:MAG TPA: hypothetical protein VFI29_23230 [Hanamia sp.]|nr:hypothetical protein [Hanamia sp.]
MKSKTFYPLFFLAMTYVLAGTSSCNKPYQPIGTNKYERPFFDYLWYHSLLKEPGGPKLNVQGSDGPLEIGYSFTSSIPGIVDKLGIMLPDSGKTYAVSLWDGVTKELLVQKNIQILHPNLFNYVDLLPTNEFKVILANHPYMIGVFTAAISASTNLEGDNFYYVQVDGGNIFPFTGYPHVVNFNQEYTLNTESPAFPKNPWPFGYVVTGLCDIEFTYVQPFKGN